MRPSECNKKNKVPRGEGQTTGWSGGTPQGKPANKYSTNSPVDQGGSEPRTQRTVPQNRLSVRWSLYLFWNGADLLMAKMRGGPGGSRASSKTTLCAINATTLCQREKQTSQVVNKEKLRPIVAFEAIKCPGDEKRLTTKVKGDMIQSEKTNTEEEG